MTYEETIAKIRADFAATRARLDQRMDAINAASASADRRLLMMAIAIIAACCVAVLAPTGMVRFIAALAMIAVSIVCGLINNALIKRDIVRIDREYPLRRVQ